MDHIIKFSNGTFGNVVKFVNGTAGNVENTCKDWCLEQHYIFTHNEAVEKMWILVIALFVLIIYWALKNCPDEKYNEFLATYNLRMEQLEKILNSMIPLTMLLIVMYIIYWMVSLP